MVKRRALVAAGVAMVPVPALDWMTGVGLLMELLPRINAEFGLSNEQIERLAPDRRLVVYKAISTGGGMLVGKIVTRDLVIWMLKLVGVRLTTQQAAKFVPIAGQAVSAVPAVAAIRPVQESGRNGQPGSGTDPEAASARPDWPRRRRTSSIRGTPSGAPAPPPSIRTPMT